MQEGRDAGILTRTGSRGPAAPFNAQDVGLPSFTLARICWRSCGESSCLCTLTACCAAAATTSSSVSAEIATEHLVSLGNNRQSMYLRAIVSPPSGGNEGTRESRPPRGPQVRLYPRRIDSKNSALLFVALTLSSRNSIASSSSIG